MAPHAETISANETHNELDTQSTRKSHGTTAKRLDDDVRMHEGSFELFNISTNLHKASLVGLHSVGILDNQSAKRIGKAIESTIADHDRPEAAASIDYLDFESRMARYVGPEASLLHLGRSRQDLLSTYSRQILRNRTLEVMGQLIDSRRKLLGLAARHTETVIPMFTHGVPAQPTTFGHYLLAMAGAMERSQERLFQSYKRLNVSPFGVAVGTTSSFPLDRSALASMLGFEGIIENSFDANHVASIDVMQDVVYPLNTLALQIGTIVQDMTTMQATSHPWLTTATPGFTGVSSIMPQKRNPRILEYIRETASEILAGSHMATIMAHNTTSGLTDVRETFQKLPFRTTIEMLELFGTLMDSVHINSEEALDQVSHDYSTVTELVDVLYSSCGVPFRTGHEFASRLVDYGRRQRIGAMQIGYPKASEIYYEVTGCEFPLTESQFLDCLEPTWIVQRRRGLGGPQMQEMSRMLIECQNKLKQNLKFLQQLNSKLQKANITLNTKFAFLL